MNVPIIIIRSEIFICNSRKKIFQEFLWNSEALFYNFECSTYRALLCQIVDYSNFHTEKVNIQIERPVINLLESCNIIIWKRQSLWTTCYYYLSRKHISARFSRNSKAKAKYLKKNWNITSVLHVLMFLLYFMWWL